MDSSLPVKALLVGCRNGGPCAVRPLQGIFFARSKGAKPNLDLSPENVKVMVKFTYSTRERKGGCLSPSPRWQCSPQLSCVCNFSPVHTSLVRVYEKQPIFWLVAVMWSETVGLRTRLVWDQKSRSWSWSCTLWSWSWSCRSGVCVVKHGLVMLVVIMILKDTATFLYSVLGTSLLWRSTVAFTYLKDKSAKCLCLLPVVLVSLFWF